MTRPPAVRCQIRACPFVGRWPEGLCPPHAAERNDAPELLIDLERANKAASREDPR